LKGLFLVAAGIFLSAVFFIQSFLNRLNLIGLSALSSIQNSVYAFTLQPTETTIKYLSNHEGEFLATIVFSITNIAQYYCHGIFELFYQIDNFDGYQHSLGGNTFLFPTNF